MGVFHTTNGAAGTFASSCSRRDFLAAQNRKFPSCTLSWFQMKTSNWRMSQLWTVISISAWLTPGVLVRMSKRLSPSDLMPGLWTSDCEVVYINLAGCLYCLTSINRADHARRTSLMPPLIFISMASTSQTATEQLMIQGFV